MRASILFCANMARMRISTIAAKSKVNPTRVKPSGQSSAVSMLDPRSVMLGP